MMMSSMLAASAIPPEIWIIGLLVAVMTAGAVFYSSVVEKRNMEFEEAAKTLNLEYLGSMPNGVPKEIEISQAQVAEALHEPVQQICEAVMTALEATPPDLAADIVDRGVMLTGGGALLGDLDLALREQNGLAISVADESLNCVALGTGKALEYEKQLRHVIDYDS